ncbi:protein kinase [Blautia schinkii]|nr:protein kinase [Blautia schinkii]
MILKNRYCILEPIGKGGGGSLFLARDIELGTLWAVKQIPIADKKEAKLLRLLEHPSLPKMVDYLEKDEFCYLVMEYIRGKSLGQWLREGRHFSVSEAVGFGMEAAEVLQYLHSRKPPVYYGDLKPDNLMLSEAGRLYLVDFGSAVFGYGIHQRVCQGTRGFAAPEQYDGRLSGVSDIYALGRTLWALLGKSKWQLVLRHPGFGRIICKCCHKEEPRRYKDMEQVAKALACVRRYGRSRSLGLVLAGGLACIALCLVLVIAGGILRQGWEKPDFWANLTRITERYYEDEFLQGDYETQHKICREAEAELQLMLRSYEGEEEQRRILLLLATGCEYQGQEEQAAIYYEQLLRDEPQCREVYGEYGMFLWRVERFDESRKLWTEYEKKDIEGFLADGVCRNLLLWEEKINEQKKEEVT